MNSAPGLVPEEVDEEWGELVLPDGGGADAGERHEDLGARLPHTPHVVLAQAEEEGEEGANWRVCYLVTVNGILDY